MLSSNQQGKKELKKDHSTAQPKSTIHPPWNSSTRAPLRKKSEKQELGSIEGLKKLTRTTSRPAFSPALSTSNSFSRLNEFDSRNTSITFASTKNQFSTFNTQLKQKLTLISKPVSTPSIRRTVINQSPSQNDLFVMFERILASNNPTDKELKSSTKKLRQLVTLHGLPQTLGLDPKFNLSGLRCRVWKIFLGVYKLSSQEYCHFILNGPSHQHAKIKNDTFRTMPTDKLFSEKVDQDMLSRLLNAFIWKTIEQPHNRLLNYTFTYVQGMNVIAAPFLFQMPELDAFQVFSSLIQNNCPLYFQPALEGVHCGVKLLDVCLRILAPELHLFLESKGLSTKVYGFPAVMTFCACVKPLSQVLILWDFLLASGVHLNIVCICAQLMMIQSELMDSKSPMKILRTFPTLNAREVIERVKVLVKLLPEDVYDTLARHPFDPVICDILMTEDEQVHDIDMSEGREDDDKEGEELAEE